MKSFFLCDISYGNAEIFSQAKFAAIWKAMQLLYDK